MKARHGKATCRPFPSGSRSGARTRSCRRNWTSCAPRSRAWSSWRNCCGTTAPGRATSRPPTTSWTSSGSSRRQLSSPAAGRHAPRQTCWQWKLSSSTATSSHWVKVCLIMRQTWRTSTRTTNWNPVGCSARQRTSTRTCGSSWQKISTRSTTSWMGWLPPSRRTTRAANASRSRPALGTGWPYAWSAANSMTAARWAAFLCVWATPAQSPRCRAWPYPTWRRGWTQPAAGQLPMLLCQEWPRMRTTWLRARCAPGTSCRRSKRSTFTSQVEWEVSVFASQKQQAQQSCCTAVAETGRSRKTTSPANSKSPRANASARLLPDLLCTMWRPSRETRCCNAQAFRYLRTCSAATLAQTVTCALCAASFAVGHVWTTCCIAVFSALLLARALPSIPSLRSCQVRQRGPWTSSTSWTSRTTRGPGLGAPRQHPLRRGGADRPGSAGLSSRRSGEPPMARPWAPFSGPFGNGPFGPKPGREPFGSKFRQVGGFFGRHLKCPSGTIGKWPFWTKSWPGAFWKQISAIWGPLGQQLKSPSGTIGKRPFWAKSWPGAFWKQISAWMRRRRKQKKIQLFEGQIKAKRTVLEPGKTEKGLASSKRRF